MMTRWEGFGGMSEKGERDQEVQIISYKNGHRDVKYSIGNIINNTVKLCVVSDRC